MSKLVLIVEDSEACTGTLHIALESNPWLEARVSPTPCAAMEVLRENSEVVAVVTDLNLPQSDGFDLIRELRAHPRFARLPIVLISGDSDPRLPAKALAQG